MSRRAYAEFYKEGGAVSHFIILNNQQVHDVYITFGYIVGYIVDQKGGSFEPPRPPPPPPLNACPVIRAIQWHQQGISIQHCFYNTSTHILFVQHV